MPASFHDISNGLVGPILKLVPEGSISFISLVGQTRHEVSFSLLHHTVVLTEDDYAEHFVQRVLNELDNTEGKNESDDKKDENQDANPGEDADEDQGGEKQRKGNKSGLRVTSCNRLLQSRRVSTL